MDHHLKKLKREILRWMKPNKGYSSWTVAEGIGCPESEWVQEAMAYLLDDRKIVFRDQQYWLASNVSSKANSGPGIR